MADTWTGDNAYLRMTANVVNVDAAGNFVDIDWELGFGERNSGTLGWTGGGVSASVSVYGDGFDQQIWSGSFGFDFRPGGTQYVRVASGRYRHYNYGDGNARGITFRGNNGGTGTSTGGGGAQALQGVGVPNTKVAPQSPSNFTATYISDSYIQLNWTNNGAANGQATNDIIYVSENGAPWRSIADVQASSSALWGAASPNTDYWFLIGAYNEAGSSPTVPSANHVQTTPASPTNLVATKQANLDIVLTWQRNASFSVNYEVWHGTVSGNTITWDASPLATVGDVATYTHAAPNASQVHVYRTRAKLGSLLSDYATSNSVQLLVAPNKPTVPALPATADKASALTYTWVHNPQDTTPQSAYEFATSTNGGTSWTTTGKVAGSVSSRTIAAGTYPANTALQMRVRTWGSATTGGSDSAGASPWSDTTTVTFKTVPTVAITVPANGSSINDSTARATLAFAQAEGATFVKAQLELKQGATTLETRESTNLVGIAFSQQLQNAGSYTIRARVQDSNGLWSAWASNTFSVSFLPPVPATVSAYYLPDNGFGQLNMLIPAPTAQQSAAQTVTLTRTINGVTETLVKDYPVASELSFLDTTPTIKGTNTYTVTTTSALGSQSSVTATLVTTECRRAFLSKGPGFSTVGVFGGGLKIDESLSVASDTVQAAGRVKPIGLYGVETGVQVKVESRVFGGFGSTLDQLRDLLLVPGKACYRDSSGRRVFGAVSGSISREKIDRGDIKFTLTETS